MSLNYDGKPGEYSYSQGLLGKSGGGVVAMGPQSERDFSVQRNAGGEDRQPGDHGGHLIAHSMGGKNEPCNIDAQAAEVNQIDQGNVEKTVSRLAADENNTVAIEVSNFNSVGERPDATMINVGVRDNTTGVVDEQHLSFQNASHDLQESWNGTVYQYATEIDPTQDAGMTAEQREMANELCGAENAVDTSLGSGWSYTDFDSSFLDGGKSDANSAGAAGVSGDCSREAGGETGGETSDGAESGSGGCDLGE